MKQLLIAVLSVFMLAGCATKQPSNNEVATTNKTETTTSNKNNKPSKNKKPVEKVEEHKDSSNSNSTDKQLENKPVVKPNVETKPAVESMPVKPQAQVQKPEEVKPTPQLETPKPQPQPAPQPEPVPTPQPQMDLPGDLNHDGYVDDDEIMQVEAVELMGYINEYRVQNGLHPLKPLPALQAFADKRAIEITSNFSHNSQYDVNDETGLERSSENIAYGLNAFGVFNAWKQSPGHNYGMLKQSSVYGAVGFAQNNTGQLFCVLITLSNVPSEGGWQ